MALEVRLTLSEAAALAYALVRIGNQLERGVASPPKGTPVEVVLDAIRKTRARLADAQPAGTFDGKEKANGNGNGDGKAAGAAA